MLHTGRAGTFLAVSFGIKQRAMDRIHGVARGELGADVTCELIPWVVVEQFKPESVSHYPFVALAAMHSGVAFRARRDQVFDGVGSRMAAELSVMHLKIRHRGDLPRLTLSHYRS